MIYRQQLHNTHVKQKERYEKKKDLFDMPLFSRAWFETTGSSSNSYFEEII
jgi:hypothetical protein